MTRDQIIWQVGIDLLMVVVGMILQMFLQPLFKRVWTRMNRPGPLTARDKGKLVEQITMQEHALERLNYFSSNPKDLFLYLYSVALTALLLFIIALCFYLAIPKLPLALTLPLISILVSLSVLFFIMGVVEAIRLSDDKIDAHKEIIRKSIEDAKKKLNTPV
jgi:hypothetical protein